MAAVIVALGVTVGGCSSAGRPVFRVQPRVVAHPHSRPQLVLVRTRVRISASSVRYGMDVILMTLGEKQDRVLFAGPMEQGGSGPLDRPVAWSPDGSRVAFADGAGARRDARGIIQLQTDIFLVDADGSGQRQLTHTRDAWDPVWSPDGREIVFARQHAYYSVSQDKAGYTTSLWAIHPDGAGLRQLTTSLPGRDDEPGAFSPDGRWLAFTRTEPAPTSTPRIPNTSSVWLLNLADGSVREVARESSSPSFSPDGKWIALSSTRDHNGSHHIYEASQTYSGDLYRVDLASHSWQRLTDTNGADEEFPSVSPSGTRIAYVRDSSVYEMNADGSCPTAIRKARSYGRSVRTSPAFLRVLYSAATWRPGNSQTNNGQLRCHHT
jgi:Tol biopolymer transport system component